MTVEWTDRVAAIRAGGVCPCHGFAWHVAGGVRRCVVDVEDDRARDYDAIVRDAAAAVGNACADCGRGGYDRGPGWDWHHVDPSTWAGWVGSMSGAAPDRIRAELAKCVLLCRRCHRLRHRGAS